jgi:anti-sigma factor RsiW
MTDPRHDQFVESAAAYALGAMDSPEREQFEAHLRTCATCEAEVEA